MASVMSDPMQFVEFCTSFLKFLSGWTGINLYHHNEEMKAMVGYSSCYLENNHNHVRERVDCGPVRENRSAYYNEMSAMDGCATV